MKQFAHAWRVTDVRAIPGDSAFLLDNGKTAILFDSGFGFTGQRIAENIRCILGCRSLDYIFLSHSHYDHALASVAVHDAYPTAKIAAGAHTAHIFEKPTARAVMREMDCKCAAANGITDHPDDTARLHVDFALSDGENVPGTDFRVIALPGHTRCSVGFYDENSGLLLSSETLGVFYGEDGYIPAFLVGYEMTLASFARARELDITAMLLPHRGLITGAAVTTFLSESERVTRETAAWILDRIHAGMTDEEILSAYTARVYVPALHQAYPPDAFRLNSSIMIGVVRRELGQQTAAFR